MWPVRRKRREWIATTKSVIVNSHKLLIESFISHIQSQINRMTTWVDIASCWKVQLDLMENMETMSISVDSFIMELMIEISRAEEVIASGSSHVTVLDDYACKLNCHVLEFEGRFRALDRAMPRGIMPCSKRMKLEDPPLV